MNADLTKQAKEDASYPPSARGAGTMASWYQSRATWQVPLEAVHLREVLA